MTSSHLFVDITADVPVIVRAVRDVLVKLLDKSGPWYAGVTLERREGRYTVECIDGSRAATVIVKTTLRYPPEDFDRITGINAGALLDADRLLTETTKVSKYAVTISGRGEVAIKYAAAAPCPSFDRWKWEHGRQIDVSTGARAKDGTERALTALRARAKWAASKIPSEKKNVRPTFKLTWTGGGLSAQIGASPGGLVIGEATDRDHDMNDLVILATPDGVESPPIKARTIDARFLIHAIETACAKDGVHSIVILESGGPSDVDPIRVGNVDGDCIAISPMSPYCL